jgi:hypothetical protein
MTPITSYVVSFNYLHVDDDRTSQEAHLRASTAWYGDSINFLYVRKPDGKRPLGRPRRRWIDNIKNDLLEIGLSVLDWIGLAQDRYRWRALVNAVMNLRVP